MIRKALVAAAALLVVLSIGSVALAQSDCSKIVSRLAVGPERPDRRHEPRHRRR